LRRRGERDQRRAEAAEAEAVRARGEAEAAAKRLSGEYVGSLELLTGLQARAGRRGGIRYEDPGLGFAFEVAPGEGSADASGMALGDEEISYIPVSLGLAEGHLPEYLSEEITFTVSAMPHFLAKMLPGVVQARKALKRGP